VVRQGPHLHTAVIGTVPYGAHVQVLQKVVVVHPQMGGPLRRLRIRATSYGQNDNDNDDYDGTATVIEGWCSECFNPLSGQRGTILQPIPLAVPVWYRQVQPTCVVRRGIELNSPIVRTFELPPGNPDNDDNGQPSNGNDDDDDDDETTRMTMIPVLSRTYTQHPIQNCLQRLKLAPRAYASHCLNTVAAAAAMSTTQSTTLGHGTIISGDHSHPWSDQRLDELYHDSRVLIPTEKIDGSFDPEAPGLYHWNNYLKWKPYMNDDANTGDNAAAVVTSYNDNNNDDDEHSLSSLESIDPIKESAPPPDTNSVHRHPLCMCCYDQVANATLVHGETGHICCCLACGKKCQQQGLGCPICRLTIDQVIQHFYS